MLTREHGRADMETKINISKLGRGEQNAGKSKASTAESRTLFGV